MLTFCEYFLGIHDGNLPIWKLLEIKGSHEVVIAQMTRSLEFIKTTNALPSLIMHPQLRLSTLAFKLQISNKFMID
jgi:hypothetical protein